MDPFMIALGVTLLAGLSTGVGAALAFFAPRGNQKFLSSGLGFSAGVMVYVSFMEILPKARGGFEHSLGVTQGGWALLATFFAGFLFSLMVDFLIPEDVNPHDLKAESELDLLKPDSNPTGYSVMLERTGLFTAIAIAIHNFPEGFATFSATLKDPEIGLPIALAIAIHNIPEGMAVSLPIYHATGNRIQAFWKALASGLSEPVGAVVGYLLLAPIMGDLTLSITFALVAGIMIYIAFDELLPAARVYGNAHTTISGIAAGMMVMGSSLLFLA